MKRLLLLLAIPAWSAAAAALVAFRPAGGRRLAWGAAVALSLLLAAWAGSRVGTANPVSRTGRWDPWLMFVMGTLLLAIPAAAITWGAAATLAAGRPWWQGVVAGTLAGLAALPIAFAAAVLVEVAWPH